jgi:hypothetical protein
MVEIKQIIIPAITAIVGAIGSYVVHLEKLEWTFTI